jgi:hypothetical protein
MSPGDLGFCMLGAPLGRNARRSLGEDYRTRGGNLDG